MSHAGPLSLVRGRRYTVEAALDPGEHQDRCIYYMVAGATWQAVDPFAGREFHCEYVESSVTSTFRTDTATGGEGLIRVRVAEYDALRRRTVAELYMREFNIVWVD